MELLKKFLLLTPVFILGLCMASCSDDDDEGGGGGKGKDLKLSEVTFAGGGRYSISYDSDGRMIGYEYYEGGVLDRIAVFRNGSGSITVNVTGSGGYSNNVVYELNGDGYIERMEDMDDGGIVRFKYDDGQRLAEASFIDSYGSSTERFTWENGNLVKVSAIDDDGRTEEWTYEYNDEPSWKGVVYWDDALLDISIPQAHFNFLANMGYLGKLPANLVSGYRDGDSSMTYSLSYRFGSDGYVSEILSGGVTGAMFTWK